MLPKGGGRIRTYITQAMNLASYRLLYSKYYVLLNFYIMIYNNQAYIYNLLTVVLNVLRLFYILNTVYSIGLEPITYYLEGNCSTI